jgi:hypothetical protein
MIDQWPICEEVKGKKMEKEIAPTENCGEK